MKATVVLASTLAVASAFAPAPVSRVSTELNAAKKPKEEKKPLFESIFGMDLFAPNPDVNTYGARAKKNIVTGKITDNSYIPNGLTKAQYEKIRADEVAKKNANYQRNVAKAGKFEDYTEWYKKRGTDTSQDWIKSVTRGHRMVKTKYDFSGQDKSADKTPEQFLKKK